MSGPLTAVAARLRAQHYKVADYRGTDQSTACSRSRHGECRGSVAIMDQDGLNHYMCSCHCHATYSCSACKRRWPCDVIQLLDAEPSGVSS